MPSAVEEPFAPEEATVLSTVRSESAVHVWLSRHLTLTLMAVIGMTVGIGVTYLALRPTPAPSVFGGPPSVKHYDRPATATGQIGVTLPAAFTPVAPASEPLTARAALSSFLDAEIADLDGASPARSEASFALLEPDAQREVGSVAAWRQTRAERVVPASYVITNERRVDNRVELTVAASRTPSITPFRGLVAAETTEVWSLAPTDQTKGWRVQRGRPVSVAPHLAADSAAVTDAQRWIDGASRCDRSIVALQLQRDLLGSPQLAQLACTTKGTWRATGALPVGDLDDITPFVATYGSGVGRWGRGVEVANGDKRFVVVVGPVGDDWRVMGLLPAAGSA
jgi:hypothetical protein